MPSLSSALLEQQIRIGIGAASAALGERVQSLWGGYGELRRVTLLGAAVPSAMVKIVSPPPLREVGSDPRLLRSHRRKLRSYDVELAFYRNRASQCSAGCRVPAFLFGAARDGQFLFVLEDLDTAGFPARRAHCTAQEIAACLGWLAAFHARFMGVAPDGLWKVGTYWHLATRPDELAVLDSLELRRAAPHIDERLNAARFRSVLHGDAKLENFCFSATGAEVAAVDFQYAGGGVGMKDVAYFLSSCVSRAACERDIPSHLDAYFAALRAELERHAQLSPSDIAEVEREWRALFPWAWVDFHRFLLGWAPGYAADDRYSERLMHGVLAQLR